MAIQTKKSFDAKDLSSGRKPAIQYNYNYNELVKY